jgi:hypothetical protein
VTDVRELQPWNPEELIDFTPLGIVIEIRETQPLNAELPIDVTLPGIFTDSRASH